MPDPKPNLRHVIESAVGSVLWNVSNYPERVQARLLGQDTVPLRDKVVDAVLAVVEPTADAREVEWEYGVEWSRQRGAAYETTWTGWAWQDDLAGAQRSAASKLDGRVLRRRAPGPTEYAPLTPEVQEELPLGHKFVRDARLSEGDACSRGIPGPGLHCFRPRAEHEPARECGNDSHHGYGTGYCGDCTKEAGQ